MHTNKKLHLFVDVDDTILKSSETVINIMNKTYNINPPKTYDDLTDWQYKSIYHDFGSNGWEPIYDSDEMFNEVEMYPEFVEFYNKNKDRLYIHIVTKGTKTNLEKKKTYFDRFFKNSNNYEFIGLNYFGDWQKSDIDMENAIQIDDRIDYLNTNAAIKILFTHEKDFAWNRTSDANIDNRYDCSSWKQIIDILEFVLNNMDFLEDA